MRAVIQRVSRAKVSVDGETIGAIGAGLLVLLGVAKDDIEADAAYLADKTAGLRILEDADGKMNRSVEGAGSEILVVSQFTLYADVRRGRRPSFDAAAGPDLAVALYQRYVALLRAKGLTVATGKFRATMSVELTNDGPVTILLDSKNCFDAVSVKSVRCRQK